MTELYNRPICGIVFSTWGSPGKSTHRYANILTEKPLCHCAAQAVTPNKDLRNAVRWVCNIRVYGIDEGSELGVVISHRKEVLELIEGNKRLSRASTEH